MTDNGLMKREYEREDEMQSKHEMRKAEVEGGSKQYETVTTEMEGGNSEDRAANKASLGEHPAMYQVPISVKSRKEEVRKEPELSGIGNKMVFVHKPISTTSTAAQQAAQQVTPEKLSQLLLDKGPLAIRFITKALSQEIPKFADLSASKQRRLIMSALESGDERNCVIFAKIGWGQWSAVQVEDPSQFVKQRELTNMANSKIKDQMASERRKSSGATTVRPTIETAEEGTSLKPGRNATNSTYLDENVLVSDDDDYEDNRYYDEDEDEEEFDNYRFNQDNLRRRQSSVTVMSDNSPPNELEMAVRSRLKQGSRSLQRRRPSHSSSKIRSSSISKPYRSSLSSLNHPNGSETLLIDPLRRISQSSDNRSKSMINLGSSEPENDLLNHLHSTRRESRRESRLSFTNESSIRSTLVSHLKKQNTSQERDQDNGHEVHSDTDEEDWQAIGAETLRQHGSSPKSSSPRDQSAAIALMSLKS